MPTFWRALLDPSLMQESNLRGKTRVKLREKRTHPSSHMGLLAVSSLFLFSLLHLLVFPSDLAPYPEMVAACSSERQVTLSATSQKRHIHEQGNLYALPTRNLSSHILMFKTN
jgi:hypothetical protein